jgi:hypothetical protein
MLGPFHPLEEYAAPSIITVHTLYFIILFGCMFTFLNLSSIHRMLYFHCDLGFRILCSSPGRVKIFLLSKSSRPALASTQPLIQWVSGALSPGVKQLGREVDHSPPASAKVKNMWIYLSTLPNAFKA